MNVLSFSSGVRKTLLISEAIGQNLRRVVVRFVQRHAFVIVSQDNRATYADFWQQIKDVARSLVARGIEKGNCFKVRILNQADEVVFRSVMACIAPQHLTNKLGIEISRSIYISK